MDQEKAPVPASQNQWPEARSFRRLYTGHPEYQARFVKALLGLRQDAIEWRKDMKTAEAIAQVITAFSKEFPEYLQDGFIADGDIGTGTYHLDERLKIAVEDLGSA